MIRRSEYLWYKFKKNRWLLTTYTYIYIFKWKIFKSLNSFIKSYNTKHNRKNKKKIKIKRDELNYFISNPFFVLC